MSASRAGLQLTILTLPFDADAILKVAASAGWPLLAPFGRKSVHFPNLAVSSAIPQSQAGLVTSFVSAVK